MKLLFKPLVVFLVIIFVQMLFVPLDSFIKAQPDFSKSTTFRGHEKSISSIAYSSDGKYLVSGSDDKSIKIWSIESGNAVRTISEHKENVNTVAFSPDGKYIASGSDDKTARIWSATSGNMVYNLSGHDNYVFAVCFSPDGRYIATGSVDKTIKIWSLSDGELLKTITGHTATIRGLCFSPDGKMIASASRDGTVRVWSATSGSELNSMKGHSGTALCVAFSNDGKYLVSGGLDKTVRIWSVETGMEKKKMTGHTGDVNAVRFSPDDKYVFSASDDFSIKMWSVTSGDEVRSLKGPEKIIRSIALSPDGRYIAMANSDPAIIFWKITPPFKVTAPKVQPKTYVEEKKEEKPKPAMEIKGKFPVTELRRLSGHKGTVNSIAFSPDGRTLVSGSSDNSVILWSVDNGSIIHIVKGDQTVNSVAFSPDGRYFASGSDDKTAKLYSGSNGDEIRTFSGHTNYVFSVAFSPDSKQLLTGSVDKSLKVWSVETGENQQTLTGHTSSIRSIAFSRDGKYLASGSRDNTVRFWSLSIGEDIRTYTGHTATVLSVAFSPDTRYLASGSVDKTVKLWSIETGEVIRTITEHTGDINCVAFSPDGKYLASASDDKVTRIWSVENGDLRATLPGHDNIVKSVAFSPDGKYIATAGSGENLIIIWKIETPLVPIVLAKKADRPAPQPKAEPAPGKTKDTKAPVIAITNPKVSRGMKVASKDKSYIIKGKVSDESGVYEVLVNGKDANLSQTGDFWAEIKMAVGENKVIVKATDTENNSSEESFFLVREGGAAPAPEEPKAPDTQPALGGARYFALIIAVQDYGDRSINPLANPIKDGQELITALTISYDFEKKDAKLLKNPGRSEILTALNDLRKQVSATDNVLIFYAGHGYWDAEIKQGYWLPSDATKDNRANWISNSDLRDNIRGIKSRHTLLISDACFSGGIFRTRAAFSNAPPAIQELYQLPSRKAMTSGTLTEVPDESVFLSYLIKRLKDNKEKYLTAEGLFTSFKQAVISNSRQVPQFGEIQDAGDEGGDFVFVRK